MISAQSLVLLLVFATGGSAAVVGAYGARASETPMSQAANPVERENLRSGSASWSLDQTAPPGRIEGFASEVSVLPGQKVHFHVSTSPSARYRIVLYRLGWYRGAGARIFACVPGCYKDRKGKARRHPRPARGTGLIRARWPVTDTFRFPRSAVSGYFLAKLELTSGRARGKVTYIPLILRALPSRRSTILVQAGVNAWQASNSWGGKSLFPETSTKRFPQITCPSTGRTTRCDRCRSRGTLDSSAFWSAKGMTSRTRPMSTPIESRVSSAAIVS